MSWKMLLLGFAGGVGVGVGVGAGVVARRKLELGQRDRDDLDPILVFAASEPGHVFQARAGTKNARRKDNTPPLSFVDGPAAYDLRGMSAKYSMAADGGMYLVFEPKGTHTQVDVILEPETRFTMPGQIGQLYSVKDSQNPMIMVVLDELVRSSAAVEVAVNMIQEQRSRQR